MSNSPKQFTCEQTFDGMGNNFLKEIALVL